MVFGVLPSRRSADGLWKRPRGLIPEDRGGIDWTNVGWWWWAVVLNRYLLSMAQLPHTDRSFATSAPPNTAWFGPEASANGTGAARARSEVPGRPSFPFLFKELKRVFFLFCFKFFFFFF